MSSTNFSGVNQWQQIRRKLLESGMADFSIRELLVFLLSSVGIAERNAYLERNAEDRSNGFYDRSVRLGLVPVELRVPRSRNGTFRPTSLQGRYQRSYTEESESLLMGLLASSRSLNAARGALEKMGLSRSQQDLDRIATHLIEEFELRNSRPVDPDLLALFVDGKYVEMRDGGRLRPKSISYEESVRRGTTNPSSPLDSSIYKVPLSRTSSLTPWWYRFFMTRANNPC